MHWTKKGKAGRTRLCRHPDHLRNSVEDKEDGQEQLKFTGPHCYCEDFQREGSAKLATTEPGEPGYSPMQMDEMDAQVPSQIEPPACKTVGEVIKVLANKHAETDKEPPPSGDPVPVAGDGSCMSADGKTRLYPTRLPDGRVVVGHETPWPGEDNCDDPKDDPKSIVAWNWGKGTCELADDTTRDLGPEDEGSRGGVCIDRATGEEVVNVVSYDRRTNVVERYDMDCDGNYVFDGMKPVIITEVRPLRLESKAQVEAQPADEPESEPPTDQ